MSDREHHAAYVTEIVVQYARPATVTQVVLRGVIAGPVAGGILEGNGTSLHRLILDRRLPDRDRYLAPKQAYSGRPSRAATRLGKST